MVAEVGRWQPFRFGADIVPYPLEWPLFEPIMRENEARKLFIRLIEAINQSWRLRLGQNSCLHFLPVSDTYLDMQYIMHGAQLGAVNLPWFCTK